MNSSYNYFLNEKELGIYIHFPWCLQKCHYCDFYSIGIGDQKKANKGFSFASKRTKNSPSPLPEGLAELIELYTENLLYEFELRLSKGSYFSGFEKISSVYFGGGTPSLLAPQTIEKILGKIRQNFSLLPNCEISLEGNPENMTLEYLRGLYELGIRRVNLGLQSFQANVLKEMNRFYSRERYGSILDDLSKSPFQNYGVDLIYGFPGQTKNDFYKDLERVLRISPVHLSLYGLTVEENTAYGRAVERKRLPAPDEELQADIFENLTEDLKSADLQHYELSNFAKENKWCRHNLSYWLYAPYMGLGPGAHGFTGYFRYANPRNLQQWFAKAEENSYKPHEPLLEMPLMFLRLCAPWPLKFWERLLSQRCRFTRAVSKAGTQRLYKWAEQGLADIFSHENEKDGYFFQWRPAGILFLNERIEEMHRTLAEAAN